MSRMYNLRKIVSIRRCWMFLHFKVVPRSFYVSLDVNISVRWEYTDRRRQIQPTRSRKSPWNESRLQESRCDWNIRRPRCLLLIVSQQIATGFGNRGYNFFVAFRNRDTRTWLISRSFIYSFLGQRWNFRCHETECKCNLTKKNVMTRNWTISKTR